MKRWVRVDQAYWNVLVRTVPPHCDRAIDIGCGAGEFARVVAMRARHVEGVDKSDEMIAIASSLSADVPNLTFRVDDVETMAMSGYEFISCIAAIHHMPFEPTIERFRDGLAPEGVLGIIGLFRDSTIEDYAWAAVAAPVNLARRGLVAALRVSRTPTAPRKPPNMTLPEIRGVIYRLLPGAIIRRHLLWRYSVIYRKPST